MMPVANLIHVNDADSALHWCQRAFPESQPIQVEGFKYLDVSGFALEIVPEDDKVQSGEAGSVTYWEVRDLHTEINRFESLGAQLYRGPLSIENGLAMCQFVDPFDNLIGLRGPWVDKG